MKQNITAFLLIIAVFFGCKKNEHSSKDVVEKHTEKPNIVFIMADDLGYGDIEPFGQEIIETPALSKMAKEGIRFTQHYAGNTVCAPSRCALMTGMSMGHAEIRGNKQADPIGQIPLSDEAVTVAEVLKNAGYRTALIGKWGLGIENSTGDPLKQGFDSYYGYLDQVLAHNYYPEYLLRNGKKEFLENKVVYQDSTAWHRGLGSHTEEKVEYSQDLFMEETMDFLDKQEDKPFFLYLPFTIPHDNGEAPEGYRQEIPDLGIYADKDWPRETKAYAAMITRLDSDVGKILNKLKEKGLDENTLVIFTSDNGPMPNMEFTEFFNSNGPFKGGKRDLYEGGIRIPFIARWPGKINPNTQSEHISAFWDFLPTASELAGVEPPENIDGISYLPALLGKEQPKHQYLYWEFPEKGYSVALRKGKWKAVRRNMEENPDAALELYNLKEDSGETNNVASEHPELVEEMEILLRDARTPSKEFPMPKNNQANE
ncbi:arylsulfatase [Galbibacter mesophilus]|uniref:arylsulfatase n=1 Tax=Galbibacter mesophilus TaxID=379069 RepID=UPI00191FDDBB|nr:arylsulfatase [Galbibacter mesophilus]MCM5663387.1 arylsulfatase [Galbibacter mesophilus]